MKENNSYVIALMVACAVMIVLLTICGTKAEEIHKDTPDLQKETIIVGGDEEPVTPKDYMIFGEGDDMLIVPMDQLMVTPEDVMAEIGPEVISEDVIVETVPEAIPEDVIAETDPVVAPENEFQNQPYSIDEYDSEYFPVFMQ